MPSRKRQRRKRAVAEARPKWTPIDRDAAQHLTAKSSPPGVVFPLQLGALPASLKPMPGAVSYFVSTYDRPISLNPAVTVGGELAVVRHDGEVAKAYNYVFATSSNGQVCFNGPYEDFAGHHSKKDEPVIILTLFDNTPFTT